MIILVVLIGWFTLFCQEALCVTQASLLWGVDNQGALVWSDYKSLEKGEGKSSIWHRVGTIKGKKISKVAVEEELDVWAIAENNKLFLRRNVTPQNLAGVLWSQVGGLTFKDISAGPAGSVWGVRTDGTILKRIGFSEDAPQGTGWLRVKSRPAKKVVLGLKGGIAYISEQGDVFRRVGISSKCPHGIAWQQTMSNIQDMAISPTHSVWVITKDGKVLFSKGPGVLLPGSRNWMSIKAPEKIKELSVGPDLQVWGISEDNKVVTRFGLTPTYQQGAAWDILPESISSIAAASLTSSTPGGASYSHLQGEGALYQRAAFDDIWQFKNKGKGVVQFKARAGADLHVYLTEEKGRIDERSYQLVVGGNRNNNSLLRKVGESDVLVNVQRTSSNSQLFLSYEDQSSQWQDFWLKVDNGFVSWGKGPLVNKQELMVLADATPYNVQFVGFGGGQQGVQEFRDIKIDGTAIAHDGILPPCGFSKIPGQARRIALGNDRKGLLKAFAIGIDNNVYHYDRRKMNIDQWFKITSLDEYGDKIAGFKDVAASSDGVLAGVSLAGEVYRYSWGKGCWKEIDKQDDVSFDRIAVGNKYCLWGLDKSSRNIYQWTPNGWRVQAAGGMSVSAAADGTVIAVDVAGDAYKFSYLDDEWDQVINPGKLGRIALSSQGDMWGTHQGDNMFYIWKFKKGSWQLERAGDSKVACGFKEIDGNFAGDLLALDRYGSLYLKAGASIDPKTIDRKVASYAKLFRKSVKKFS